MLLRGVQRVQRVLLHSNHALPYSLNACCALLLLPALPPPLTRYLYDSPLESQLTQLFDARQRLLYTGDAVPGEEVALAKGQHSARVALRHDDRALLDKLKGTCLVGFGGERQSRFMVLGRGPGFSRSGCQNRLYSLLPSTHELSPPSFPSCSLTLIRMLLLLLLPPLPPAPANPTGPEPQA